MWSCSFFFFLFHPSRLAWSTIFLIFFPCTVTDFSLSLNTNSWHSEQSEFKSSLFQTRCCPSPSIFFYFLFATWQLGDYYSRIPRGASQKRLTRHGYTELTQVEMVTLSSCCTASEHPVSARLILRPVSGDFKDFPGSVSLSCVLGSGKLRENQVKPPAEYEWH